MNHSAPWFTQAWETEREWEREREIETERPSGRERERERESGWLKDSNGRRRPLGTAGTSYPTSGKLISNWKMKWMKNNETLTKQKKKKDQRSKRIWKKHPSMALTRGGCNGRCSVHLENRNHAFSQPIYKSVAVQAERDDKALWKSVPTHCLAPSLLKAKSLK